MAAVGCADEKESAMDCNTNKMLSASRTIQGVVFERNAKYGELEAQEADDEVAKCIARWNSTRFPIGAQMNKAATNIANLLQKSTGASSLNLQEQRRTLRIERAGSTESVTVTSGGESCQSSSIASDSASEPSSPSRPVTPQPMPPVPAHLAIDHCHYECLRADSEDSGFGPSPAKSSMGPSSPLDTGGFSVSPIQFADDEDEGDDEELSSDTHQPTTSLLDLTTGRKNCYGTTVSDHEDAGSPQGFLPYTVSKLATSDEFQEEAVVQKECDANTSDNFRFRLPCSDDDDMDETSGRARVSLGNDATSSEQKVIDFQFLMASVNRDGCQSSDSSNDNMLTNTVSDQTHGIVLVPSHQTSTELPHSPLTMMSPKRCENEMDAENVVVPLLAADSSSCVHGSDVSLASLTEAEDMKCLPLLPMQDSSLQLDELHLVRIKTEVIEDEDQEKCIISSERHGETKFLDPKHVVGRERKQKQEVVSAVDNCDESSEDLTRSELCPELTGECTSSSCSQATTATDSQSTISTSSADDNTSCKWLNCDQKSDANANLNDLVDHLRKCHVQTQFDNNGSYVCLWVGCKVYERPSSSRSWLERHVLLHGGNKPFRCIVDGCRQRFGTEGALQRHVNSHFPQNSSSSCGRNAHGGKNGHHGEHGHHYHHNCGALGSGPNGRLLKRKRHKFRKRPHSVKTNDFFDDGIMEQVRHSLFELSSIEGMDRAGPPAAITFHSTVIARRTEGSGKIKLLLHWDPEDLDLSLDLRLSWHAHSGSSVLLLPDCWVSEDDALSNFQKTIPISSLPPETLVNLDPVYTARLLPRPGKRRRK